MRYQDLNIQDKCFVEQSLNLNEFLSYDENLKNEIGDGFNRGLSMCELAEKFGSELRVTDGILNYFLVNLGRFVFTVFQNGTEAPYVDKLVEVWSDMEYDDTYVMLIESVESGLFYYPNPEYVYSH